MWGNYYDVPIGVPPMSAALAVQLGFAGMQDCIPCLSYMGINSLRVLRNLRERNLINTCAYMEAHGVAPGYIVGLRLLHSDLLPTPVRAIDHRLAAKLQDAKSQLQELAAVHDAAELREAHACIQRVCSSFDTWPWSYLLWPWSNLFWLWSCLFWPWPCQNVQDQSQKVGIRVRQGEDGGSG